MIRNWSRTARRTVGAARKLVPARPPGGRAAPVTYTLITLCCLLFLVSPAAGLNPLYGTGEEQLAAQRAHFRRWGVIPAELFEDSPGSALTPATALFVHGSWVHLLGNMLFLYVFGAMTEQRMGRLQFTLFYLGCGYLALLGYAGANAHSQESLVGASGAISAILGAFLFLFPRARVTSLLPFLQRGVGDLAAGDERHGDVPAEDGQRDATAVGGRRRVRTWRTPVGNQREERAAKGEGRVCGGGARRPIAFACSRKTPSDDPGPLVSRGVRACRETLLPTAWSSPGAPRHGRRVAGQSAGAS
ncbi:hypothetical protein STENM223S_08663 [Streptomyces tendae]